jgi:exosortase C (VPDSG-CTERM-specific)
METIDRLSGRPPRAFLVALAALGVAFAVPLFRLGQFALDALNSYILLVPAIGLGLVWAERKTLPAASGPARIPAGILAAIGLAILLAYWLPPGLGSEWSERSSLTLTTLSFLCLLAAICGWFLGGLVLRAVVFPLCFLILMVPLPTFVAHGFQAFLQEASAGMAGAFFAMAGMPVFRHGLLGFQLPGINLEVAPQCSGLNASLALFITSLPAGYLFLRTPWKRAVFTLAVLPLAILRNGFRIFTIGELCVHIGPQMIDSYIHRTGGWIFFLISLGPLFLLLLLLGRGEPRPAR